MEKKKRRAMTPRHYLKLWDSMEILPKKRRRVESACKAILRHKRRYVEVEALTGVPWPVVAVVHRLESSGNFKKCLHNGQALNKKTTLVPKNCGPFLSFGDAAEDALLGEGHKPNAEGRRKLHAPFAPRGIGAWARWLEIYNGTGYADRQVESPYLWSFCNHGVGVGKFYADRKYSTSKVSNQVGAMCMLKWFVEKKRWSPEARIAGAIRPFWLGQRGAEVLSFQRALKGLGARIAVDGIFGPKTLKAAKACFADIMPGIILEPA